MVLTVSRAEELLQRFRTRRILVVGDAFFDVYIRVFNRGPNPEDPSKSVFRAEEPEAYRSGGAGNAARNCAMLGARTDLFCVLGDDDHHKKFYTVAAEEGYGVTVIPDQKRTTILKRRIIEATRSNLVDRYDLEPIRSTSPVSADIADRLLEMIKAKIGLVDGVLVSDYAKGVISHEVVPRLLDLAVDSVKRVIADIKPASASYFTGAAILKPNFAEGCAMVGMSGHSAEPVEVARQLADAFNTQIFLTLGDRGICYASKYEDPVLIKQDHQVEIADASGCGDTVGAMLLLAILSDATPVEAAELANAAAAVTVSKVGAYAPSRHEVLDMLARK